MSRKTRAFRVFLHQNQNPTIKQTWDTAWKRAQKIFHARSMQDMEEKLAAAQAECERLRKDAERYRWLRARWGRITETYYVDSGRIVEIGTEPDGEGWDIEPETLDAAIDAELAKVGDA